MLYNYTCWPTIKRNWPTKCRSHKKDPILPQCAKTLLQQISRTTIKRLKTATISRPRFFPSLWASCRCRIFCCRSCNPRTEVVRSLSAAAAAVAHISSETTVKKSWRCLSECVGERARGVCECACAWSSSTRWSSRPRFLQPAALPTSQPHPKPSLLRLKLHTPQFQSSQSLRRRKDLGVCHLRQTPPPPNTSEEGLEPLRANHHWRFFSDLNSWLRLFFISSKSFQVTFSPSACRF